MAEQRQRKRSSSGALLVCGALLLLAGIFESLQQPTAVAHGYLVGAHSKDAAAAQAAGEFRIVIANVLWDKVVDHYHHQYMADGGDWEKNESLLPMLHTIIALDPHFVEAYELMGGTILLKTGHVTEGRDVLAAGIKNNPYDWELYRDMAMLYALNEHEPAAALPYAQQGLTQTDDDFSRRIMTRLCDTLRRRIKDGQSTTVRTGLQPAPNLTASAAKSHPSASHSVTAYPS